MAVFAERHVRLVRERAGAHDPDAVRSRVVANKTDAVGAADRLALLREMAADRLDVVPCSCAPDAQERRPLGGSVFDLPGVIFRWLRIVRVYTNPGQHFVRTKPFTVFEGGTVGDVCALVHRTSRTATGSPACGGERLQWRSCHPTAAGSQLTVSRTEPVQDGDVVELHLSQVGYRGGRPARRLPGAGCMNRSGIRTSFHGHVSRQGTFLETHTRQVSRRVPGRSSRSSRDTARSTMTCSSRTATTRSSGLRTEYSQNGSISKGRCGRTEDGHHERASPMGLRY